MDNKLYKIVSTKWLDTMRTPVVLVLFLLFAAPMALATDIGACQPLNTPDEIYNMTSDVTSPGATCFDVSANNITLECNGFAITGDSTAGTYGISVVTSDYFTAMNCNISAFADGMPIFNSNYGNYSNITMSGIQYGISMALGGNSTFNNINIQSIDAQAFRLDTTVYNTITNLNVSAGPSTGIGIAIVTSNGATFENITTYGFDFGIYASTSGELSFTNTTSNGRTGAFFSGGGVGIDKSIFNNTGPGGYSLNLFEGGGYVNNTIVYAGSIAGGSQGALTIWGTGAFTVDNITLKNADIPMNWMELSTVPDISISKLKFENDNGSIYFPQTISFGGIIMDGKLQINYNQAFIDPSVAGLNQSSIITLNGLTFGTAFPSVDRNDNGTYEICTSPECIVDSYAGGTLIFNAMHWTTYSSEEGGIKTVTLLSPDDATTFTSTPDFIFRFNNTIPTNANCSLWLNKSVPINYMTNSVVANSDNIYTLNLTLSSGNWTWWLACADGTSAVSEIRTFIISVAQPFDSMLFSVEILVIVIIAGLFMYLAIGNLGPEGTGNLLRLLFMFVGIYFIFSAFSLMSIGLKESMPLSGAIVIVDSLLQITMWIIVILLIFYALRILFGFVTRDKL